MSLTRNHFFQLTAALITLFAGLSAATLWNSHDDVCLPNHSSPCSMLDGRTVHLIPSDVEFDVPQGWLDWQTAFHNNFHLTSRQRSKVKSGYGEWDSEYAQVTNVVLPFEMCAIHAGGEGWGLNGVSFADLQMRVYVGDWVLADLRNKIATDGEARANRVASDARTAAGTHGAWQRDTITYAVAYGDYGGTANIDFYSRNHKGKTVVFVFMYEREHADTINDILNSLT